MKKIFAMIILIGTLCSLSVFADEIEKISEQELGTKIEHTVLNEKVIDVPLKTQISLEILISGEITEQNLKILLFNLYSSLKDRKGFTYHSNPTNIYIYAFISRKHYESSMGQWVAMLEKSFGDELPKISINERQIAQVGAISEEKNGFSEKQRREIWEEVVHAEDKSWQIAEEKYLPDPFSPDYSPSIAKNQLNKLADLQERLDKCYKNEIAEKYGLTLEQLQEIMAEGVEKDWPFPEEK